MKKLITGIIALILTLSALAACGSGEDGTTTVSVSSKAPASTAASTNGAPSTSSTPDVSTSTPVTSSAPSVTTSTPVTTVGSVTTAGTTAETPVTSGNPDPAVPADAKKIGSADELADLFWEINKSEVPGDVYILLTADIDLSDMKDVTDWEPVYRFSGTFDGAGHTISGLNWTFRMANDGTGNMPNANQHGSYIINEYDASKDSGSRGAEAAIALFFLKTENATLKDFTVKDSSLNLVCTYNKNYQLYVGGLVGWMEGGSVSGVKLENVDIPTFGFVGYNQKYLCYAGLAIGNAVNNVTLESVEVDENCLLDASNNVKLEVASMVGKCVASGSVTLTNCSTAATVKAGSALIESTADISKLEGAGANIGTEVGGHVAAYVAYAEDGAKVTTNSCTDNSKLTGNKA